MTKMELITQRIKESIDLKTSLLVEADVITLLADIARATEDAIRRGNKIMFAGNGGSFADSIHLAAEFVSRFMLERKPYAAIALGANNSILTAIGNDYSFADVFYRELSALGNPGDVFIGLSTSGNSENIVLSVLEASKIGVQSFCFTGQSGGRLAELCPCIRVPSRTTARIQEVHILLGHILCEMVEANLSNYGSNTSA